MTCDTLQSLLSLAENAGRSYLWPYEHPAFILLAVVVLTAAFFDATTHKIPNRLLYPAITAGFLLAAVMGYYEAGWAGAGRGLMLAGTGFLAAGVPFFLIFMSGGLGGGDVKLMAAIGAISADWEVVLGTALYGFIISMVLAVAIMIEHRIVLRTLKRIANAALMAASKVKPDLDLDTPRIPLVLGFAIGALIAGAEHLLNVRLPWM